MFSTTFKRPLVALAVVIGLLAAAGPASAAGAIKQPATPKATMTMLDYEGQTVVTYSAVPVGSTTAPVQPVR